PCPSPALLHLDSRAERIGHDAPERPVRQAYLRAVGGAAVSIDRPKANPSDPKAIPSENSATVTAAASAHLDAPSARGRLDDRRVTLSPRARGRCETRPGT